MPKAIEEAVNNIKRKIDLYGHDYNAWYIGIAKDVTQKLFVDHKVNDQNGIWIYIVANTNSDAKEIKNYFERIGVTFNNSDDDENGLFVFAYKKESFIRQ